MLLTRFAGGLRIASLLIRELTPHRLRIDPTSALQEPERVELDAFVAEISDADVDRFDDFRVAADQLEELGFDGPAIALLRAAARIRP